MPSPGDHPDYATNSGVLYNVRVVDVNDRKVLEDPLAIFWDDKGVIKDIGPKDVLTRKYLRANLIDGQGYYVTPGLIDCHVHVNFAGEPNHRIDAPWSVPELTGRALFHAEETLKAGITSIRDAGSFFGIGIGVRNAIEQGWHLGPHMRAAGSPLTMTGGHGDLQNGFPDHIQLLGGAVVDSPDEARKEARRQLRMGADVLKFMASGGVMSQGDKSTERGLLEEEMAAAVQEAKNRGKRTMAHAQAQKGIENAIRAEVDSIEHGFYLSDWAIAEMLEREIYLVATLTAVQQIIDHGSDAGIPKPSVEKAKVAQAAHQESLLKAYKAGVLFAMGTDAGTPFNFHGENAQEIKLLLDIGLNIWDVLATATKHAATLLDFPAGMIAPDYWADLVLWKGNPVLSPQILWDSEGPEQVFRQGARVPYAKKGRGE